MFNAYVIAFGGLLLLGGRLSDLFGAKRLFAAGWAVLAAGSLAAGLADSTEVEIAARAVQGAGAALIAPSALTLLMMLFGHDPKELMKAFAVYGAAAPAGGTAGVFLGGVITEWASWPWVFYINIPVALVALALTPGLMPPAPARRGSVDVVGAVLATGGLAALVFAIVRAPEQGWGASETLLVGAGGLLALALFVAVQSTAARAADAAGHLPRAQPRRRQPRAGPARRGVGADVVLPEPLPAAGARLRRVRGRGRAAAHDRGHHARHGRRRPARHGARRRQADGRRRPAGARRRVWPCCRSCAPTAASSSTCCRRRWSRPRAWRSRSSRRCRPPSPAPAPRRAGWRRASSTPATRSAPRSAWPQ